MSCPSSASACSKAAANRLRGIRDTREWEKASGRKSFLGSTFVSQLRRFGSNNEPILSCKVIDGQRAGSSSVPEEAGFSLWPAAYSQLRKLLPAASSPPSLFWLAANSHRWHRIDKLLVLGQVAIRAKRHQVLKRVIPLLASFDLVVDLEILQ